jgi:hypothetical protein
MSEKSKSEKYLENKSEAPQVSALMANSVSQFRKDKLAGEVEKGLFKDGTGPTVRDNGMTANGLVTASVGIKKQAQMVSSYNSLNTSGSGDTVKQTPEVYSPLWLNSNLSLPRDRATINAWCRSFFALNPFVQNAISLHSTYPISKLNIKCYNKEVEKFFNDMIEELDLMNIAVQIAQEFWLLGESFVYADYDKSKGKWSRLLIQNPDYVIVNRTVAADEPVISLRPDENLRRIVFSNKTRDVEQRKQLNQYIIDCVKRGDNIPLDNFHVSHIARRISPYEVRGTGLPVAVFRQLSLFDQLRESKFAQASNLINPLTIVKIGSADYKPTHADLEAWRSTFECYDEETEVLTDQGFKRFNEVIEYADSSLFGALPSKPKDGVKIACFNPSNEQLEYHQPLASFVGNYMGEMYHFDSKKMDIKVTPNHDMWVSKRKNIKNKSHTWGEWHKAKASEINPSNYQRFRSNIKWSGEEKSFVEVCGKQVPINNYLEFLGYFLSEGSTYVFSRNYCVSICQSTIAKHENYLKMKKCMEEFASHLGVKCHQSIRTNGMWIGFISNKEIFNYFKSEFGTNNVTTSAYKKIPSWMRNLNANLLNTLLDAMMLGDGHIRPSRKSGNKISRYTTTSKQLSDDVYEISYKCGYAPTSRITNRENRLTAYDISWSNFDGKIKGQFPLVRNGKGERDVPSIKVEQYSGKVWCFTVPTGLFITRRGGKITIQGNSAQYDKDFKIFTHEGVTVERVGAGGGIYDISGDITQLIKEIYTGLQVPSVLMDGGSDTTYANGGVALDVLRQRYMQFRNMMATWLKRKIFAPISKIQGFYEYKNGEKQLIVPDVDWNHMSLFDTADYVNTLVSLTQGEGEQKRASLHTLYRSLGLDAENENRNMRKESIQAAIAKKEKVSLETLTLNELRALDDDDEIPEPKEPSEVGAGGGGGVPGEPGGGMPPLDLGAPPGGGPPPSPPPA